MSKDQTTQPTQRMKLSLASGPNPPWTNKYFNCAHCGALFQVGCADECDPIFENPPHEPDMWLAPECWTCGHRNTIRGFARRLPRSIGESRSTGGKSVVSAQDEHGIWMNLRGAMCACGDPKQPGKSFCRRDYFKLPQDMRSALYQRAGYVAAFRAALAFLELPEPKTAPLTLQDGVSGSRSDPSQSFQETRSMNYFVRLKPESWFSGFFKDGVPIKQVLSPEVFLTRGIPGKVFTTKALCGDAAQPEDVYWIDWNRVDAKRRDFVAFTVVSLRGGTPREFLKYMNGGGDMPIRVSQTDGPPFPL